MEKNATEMDPALWRGLPPSLFSQIFARLPTKSVVRFRSVSKKYNKLPLESAFASLHSSLAPPTLMLITHVSQAGRDLIHCIHENGNRHVFEWDFLHLSSVFRKLQLILRVSASGFLCFSLGEDNVRSSFNVYYICNPITREWRTFRLPSQMADPLIVGMYLDVKTNSCKVIVGADRSGSEPSCKAFVYDGLHNSWKEIASLSNQYVKSATPPVLIGQHLYWLVEELNVWGSGQQWVIGFNMHEEIWMEPISISKEFVPLCVGDCNGKIVLVTMVVAKSETTKSNLEFQIWSLDNILKWTWEHTISVKIDAVNAPTGCDHFFLPSAGVVSHGVVWLTENHFHTVLKHDLRQQSSTSQTFVQNVSSRFHDRLHLCPLGFEPMFRRLEDCIAFNNGK